MKRFIIDTSVVVAAVLTRQESSPTVQWLRVLLEGTEPVLVSTELLTEYRAVLLRKVTGIDESDIDAMLATLLSHARILESPLAPRKAPDPGDAHVWALLAADPNSSLVTGDNALIKGRADGRALNPKDALERWLR